MKDPERWEDLGNGLHLLREDVPLTADEKARARSELARAAP